MPIINTLLGGSGGSGDSVKARVLDSSLVEGSKALLNWHEVETPEQYTGSGVLYSSTDSPWMFAGSYLTGSSSYYTYLINDATKSLTSQGTGSQTYVADTPHVIFQNDRFAFAWTGIQGIGRSYTGSNAWVITSADISNNRTFSISRDYLMWVNNGNIAYCRIKSDGSGWVGFKVSDVSANGLILCTPDGIINYTTGHRLVMDTSGTAATETITTSITGTQNPNGSIVQLADDLYVSVSNVFEPIVINGDRRFTFYSYGYLADEDKHFAIQKYLPTDIEQVVQDPVVSIGPLSNNRFYVCTSVQGNAEDTNLYIIDISSGVENATIEAVYNYASYAEGSSSVYHKILPSYDLKYLFFSSTGSFNVASQTYVVAPGDSYEGWEATTYNGSNFTEASYTGFVSKVNTDNTVTVDTVLLETDKNKG